MTDSFAPPTQRPAPAPDRLSLALATAIADPVACEMELADAVAESCELLAAADRGDVSPWLLSRAIDLASQFPESEVLQIHAGRLVRIMAGTAKAAACWRDMLARFPGSTRILAEYAGALADLVGREEARRIVESYFRVGDRSERSALRNARALYRLGDRDGAIATLEAATDVGPGEALRLQLARWKEDAGELGGAREALEGGPSSPAIEAERLRLAAARDAVAEVETSRPAAKPSIVALERLIDLARAGRERPIRAAGRPLGAIAIIGSTLGGGGAERQLVKTALGLAQVQARRATGPVTVYCRKLDTRRGNDFYLPLLEDAGIRVVDYRRAAAFGGDPARSILAGHSELIALLPPHMREGTERLTDLLRHDAPEVVQIWQDGTIFATGLAALLAGVPRIVLAVRTMPPTERTDRMRPEQRALYRGLLGAPGVVLTANSRIAARAYEAWLNLGEGAVEVVPNGVEKLPARAGGIDERQWRNFERETAPGFTFGGVMRLDDNKRPLEWLAIAGELAGLLQDARFVLVGDGPLRAAAEADALRRGIAARTLFVGRSSSVGYWLDRFDALALTSRHEGTPNVLIEAQLAGVPVVTTPAGGAADAVAPNPANMVLDDADRPGHEAAARHLAALAQREHAEAERDARAVSAWAARFSVPAMIERTLDLFGAPA